MAVSELWRSRVKSHGPDRIRIEVLYGSTSQGDAPAFSSIISSGIDSTTGNLAFYLVGMQEIPHFNGPVFGFSCMYEALRGYA